MWLLESLSFVFFTALTLKSSLIKTFLCCFRYPSTVAASLVSLESTVRERLTTVKTLLVRTVQPACLTLTPRPTHAYVL